MELDAKNKKMEQHETDYITKIAPELMKLIKWNVTIAARCQANLILSEEDLAELEAIPNLLEKKYRFLEILKTKHNGYMFLRESLEEVEQDGAVQLVEKIPQKMYSSRQEQTSSTCVDQQLTQKSGSEKQVYKLDFGEHDIVNTVLPMVRADLVSKMNGKEPYTAIISQLAALNYFYHKEIQILITGDHRSQQKKMLAIFAEMANLDEVEILDCFKKLCNLDDQPKASERFRKIFQKHFPDCL